MTCNTIININDLNTLILSDFNGNSTFRTTWISFKSYLIQYQKMMQLTALKI